MLFIWQEPQQWQKLTVLITLFILLCNVNFVRSQAPSQSTYVPVTVPPSEDWEGNDGPWSTFAIQIGTPPQTIKVLASTSTHETLAVAPEGCLSSEPSDCRQLRGEFYDYNSSSTWNSNLANASNIYPLDLESNLGYTGKGRYGFDDIALGFIGSGGPKLKNQTIAGIATKDFFMGLFGLTPRASNFTSFNNPIPSFMQNLRNQSIIPSLSWAYTAGNQYRFSKVLGSLVLGGYDSSRFVQNNVSFPFSVDSGLVVPLDSISTGSGVSLLPSRIRQISLDSAVPYIYLPLEACTLFENEFGLAWNDTAQLYLLNTSQHSALQVKNPTITFRVGTPPSTVEISLPYSAFDLTASWPLVANSTPYFPLKRAMNESQYVLGRTFFQEAYVIADYEIGSFSVSQCAWNEQSPANLVAILPLSNRTNSTSRPGSASSKNLPAGAIAGIGVGGAAVVICIAVLLFCISRRKRQRARNTTEITNFGPPSTQPEDLIKAELENTAILSPSTLELDGKKSPPDVEHRHELPAREEVAAEMNAADDLGRVGPSSHFGFRKHIGPTLTETTDTKTMSANPNEKYRAASMRRR